jgi:hypothetical protein
MDEYAARAKAEQAAELEMRSRMDTLRNMQALKPDSPTEDPFVAIERMRQEQNEKALRQMQMRALAEQRKVDRMTERVMKYQEETKQMANRIKMAQVRTHKKGR